MAEYTVKVNNTPEYASAYKYAVARCCDGEMWFWGAWNDINKANQVAHNIDGVVLENRNINE